MSAFIKRALRMLHSAVLDEILSRVEEGESERGDRLILIYLKIYRDLRYGSESCPSLFLLRILSRLTTRNYYFQCLQPVFDVRSSIKTFLRVDDARNAIRKKEPISYNGKRIGHISPRDWPSVTIRGEEGEKERENELSLFLREQTRTKESKRHKSGFPSQRSAVLRKYTSAAINVVDSMGCRRFDAISIRGGLPSSLIYLDGRVSAA